jgi:TetR/AcrR family transcriptional regulator, transcriptional repressor for nem operon
MARPRKFQEDDVVAAAREQFWSAGYAGTSLDDLTEATGLGRGSLYGAFGDKHDLFLRTLDEYNASVLAAVAADLRGSDASGYQRLVTHIRNTADTTVAEAQRGCLLAKSAAELGSTDQEVLKRVKRSLVKYQSELRAVIEQAQREGDIDPDADANALALLVLTLLRGSEALRKAGFAPAKMRAVAEHAIAVLPRAAVASAP